MQSKSFVQLQPDFLSEENHAHNPDRLTIDQVFGHYRKTLKSKPKLAQMLINRKIDPEYIDKIQIGFADRSLGFELQSPKCLLGSRNRGHLQRLGLLKGSGHEFFRGALVIPSSMIKVRLSALTDADYAISGDHPPITSIGTPSRYPFSDALARWQTQIETLGDCIQFYLEEIRHTGRSTKTLNASRVHLERFQSFCLAIGVENLADLTTDVLESYRQYLLREKNVFTGKLTSRSTQFERLQAVIRMLARLHYYRVIPEPLSPVSHCEAVN